MSITQSICAGLLSVVIVLLSVRPEPSVAASVFAMVALFVGVTLIEKKQNTEIDLLSAQMKDLKNKVDMLLLNKGFGR